jgi:hypothetical protein
MPELTRLSELSTALPNLASMLFYLLLAFVLAQPVAMVYVRTHQGTSYSRSFVQSLVLLPLIVTIVMLAVGDSLARAFGLFGALALIRFRTPIKDSRDTVFLFLAMAIGIAVGVEHVTLAIVGTALVLLFAIYLYGTRFGERIQHDGVLRCTLPSTGEAPTSLREVLAHYCKRFDLVSVQTAPSGNADFTYQLRLREADAHADLVADLQAIPGAADVSMLVQNEHEEV